MLLEFLKYATRLLKNNMTTIILGTTTTTAIITTTTTSSITTNFNITTNASIISNILNVIPFTPAQQLTTQQQNTSVMLPERPAATYPIFEIFNSTLKTLFNKTFDNVPQANLSNYTDYTNETSFTNTLMPPMVNVSGAGIAGGMTANAAIGGTAPATTTVMSALSTLPATRYAMETTTSFPAQTVATFMAAGNKNRATIIVYPTVAPESIVIPIVSCIFGFPILAFLVICCLRRRAKLARERDRRRNYDMQDHAVSLITDRRELSVYVLNEV